MIEFKITEDPNQKFSTVLGGRRVTINLRYVLFLDRWSFDLSIDDDPVIQGRRIVSGIDLISTFNLGIGSIFAFPFSDDIGFDQIANGEVKLYHATKEELDAAVAS